MRKALIIPAFVAASITAIPAFAYEGPVSEVKASVPEASVVEGKFPTAYLDTVSSDVQAAIMKHLDTDVEEGEGLQIDASVLGMELAPDMGTMNGQVAFYDQNGDIMTTFQVDLKADTIAGNTDPDAYYGPMIDKFASIAVDHLEELPVAPDSGAVIGDPNES